MNIITSINKSVGRGLNASASKLFSNTLENAAKNPDKFAANMLVISLVSKDAVGCYYYTTQSYNNKRIPEEKRTFVAALDFMNGVLNVGTQILAYSVIKKHVTPKLFDKYIGNKLLSRLSDKYTKEIMIKEPQKFANISPDTIATETKIHLSEKSDIYKFAKTGFALIVTGLGTTALCKRTIVPFLSTPLAGWLKENYMDKGKKPAEKADNAKILAQHEPLYTKLPAQGLNVATGIKTHAGSLFKTV